MLGTPSELCICEGLRDPSAAPRPRPATLRGHAYLRLAVDATTLGRKGRTAFMLNSPDGVAMTCPPKETLSGSPLAPPLAMAAPAGGQPG